MENQPGKLGAAERADSGQFNGNRTTFAIGSAGTVLPIPGGIGPLPPLCFAGPAPGRTARSLSASSKIARCNRYDRGRSPPRPARLGFPARSGTQRDPINGFEFLSQAYLATDPSYNARVTVPVLWDCQSKAIVSNNDDDIMRMLNSAFDDFTDSALDLYPEALRPQIDEINDLVYPNINDGVYRAGFATTQSAYEESVAKLFAALDHLEERLGQQRYPSRPPNHRGRLAPLYYFGTLDAVYHGHFKCNIRPLAAYPHLFAYLRDLYQQQGIAATVNFDHIKRHYYITHDDINPTQIVPSAPTRTWTQPTAARR